ncbi:MAG TPA: hypothetical protein VK545_14765 [Streptomyces sp.]|nr:hypothetical protein [Streptomyces sp.]
MTLTEEMWRRFVEECAQGTAAGAPREPSALARGEGARVLPPAAPASTPACAPAPSPVPEVRYEAVGELWEPQDTASPAWRDLDGPARRRRLRHLVGTACAGALLLALASLVPAHAPGEDDGLTDATVSEATPSPMPTTHEGVGTTPPTHTSTGTPHLG